MSEIRSYVVERTQRVHILSAESPAHAVALAEEIFHEAGDKVDTLGRPITSPVRTTDISAREDY